MEEKFTEWLHRELRIRGWSNRELARRSGISHTWVNTVLAGQEPDADFCIAIADALGRDPVWVQRKAGVLPPEPEGSRRLTIREIYAILQGLNEDQLAEVRHYARYLKETRETE